MTARLIAEASAWLAVLHGPNRNAATERGFSQWLHSSPDHALAFEEATSIWEESRNLPRPRSLRSAPPPRSVVRTLLALAASVVLLAVGALVYLRMSGISTGIGEQRVLALEDGSTVILNTRSRVVVSYDPKVRRIELKRGEALFEVAKRPDWPFVVTAGEHQIRALGTSFAVRRDDGRVQVTLVEGRVTVSSPSPSPSASALAPTSTPGVSSPLPSAARLADPPAASGSDSPRSSGSSDLSVRAHGTGTPALVTLSPGQRLTFDTGGAAARVDQPEIDRVLAWQRREVAFDNAALADAVAEMNRYSRVPLVVEAREAAQARVTGLFRAGDSVSFARAVAEAYKLTTVEEPGRILLKERTR
ncbi:MAG: FecR domain-containing protein [Gammaproteobacteria bacterium]